MIVRDHLPLQKTWPHVSKRLGALFLFDTTICILYTQFDIAWLGLPTLPLAIIGGALSVFLAFRNNSAYDRWWEARSLWGSLVNTARTFSRQVLTLVDDQEPDSASTSKQALVEMQIAYVHALRCHLRRQNPFPELEQHLPPEVIAHLRTQRNVPIAMLLLMAQALREYFDQGRLDSMRFTTIDRSLTELCNVQGACERIKNTPLPRQYHYFPRLLVAVYSVLLPVGLVDGLGMLTPIVSTLISFIFVSLETIGKEIENPFENTVHDTPMSSLTRTIEINLLQNLGRDRLPQEIRPIDGFVY
ncbi:MAG: bestrophin family ion channel [Acidobacteriota bacterium]